MGGKGINSVFSGLGWTFGERFFAQGVTFIVSIIIARILNPEEYGIISLVLVFINLANVFVENGFGESLIQKQGTTKEDFSTIFWCTFIFSVILYIILFFSAPFVAIFYNDGQIILIIRVLSLKLIFASINTIQRAYVSKYLQFKKFFFSTLGSTLLSGIVGVILAYTGCGVWALVVQYLVNSAVSTMIMLITVNWHPKFVFEKKEALKLLSYSWKVTSGAFINSLYIELRSLIIGKVYGAADLAYYNKGNQFPNFMITNINSAVSTVFFPVMARMQNNIFELKYFARKTIKTSSYIIFPIAAGLISVSEVLIKVLLTDKWLPCVIYIQILSIFYAVQPLQSINWQILKAVGRSDLCLKLEIIKKIIGFFLIFATMFISVEALAWSTALFAIISMIINMIPNKKIIGYSLLEQIIDVLPSLFLSIFMGVIVLALDCLSMIPALLLLIIKIMIGIIFYLGMSYILKLESLYTILDAVKSNLMKKC